MRKVACYTILLMFVFGSCATLNIQMTPKRVYYEAQIAFFNVWEPYQKAWLALPETDPRKAQWAETYHPLFLDAAILLQAWGETPDDYEQGNIVNRALDKLEALLIKLAIEKGGK